MPQKHRKTIRIQGYDYGSNGIYYITIKTKGNLHYFGKIVDDGNGDHAEFFLSVTDIFRLNPTIIGQKAIDFWLEIPEHYPFVKLDEFVVMPDHIHGILVFERTDIFQYKGNKFGPQSDNLAAVIRGFKSSLKRFANQNDLEFHWQGRFYEEIIRDDFRFNEVRSYIDNNPMIWFYMSQAKRSFH